MIYTESQINFGLECCCSSPKNCDDCPLEILNDCQIQLRKDSAELLFTYQAIVIKIEEYLELLTEEEIRMDIMTIISEEKKKIRKD